MLESTIQVHKGFKVLAEQLMEGEERISLPELSSFDNFVQDIFSKSYPQFDFDYWHVRLICRELEDAIDKGFHYACVLPRYHLKSTILGHAYTIYRMLKSEYGGYGLYCSYKDTLASIHCSLIKEAIRNNPILPKVMKDLSPTSESSLHYKVGGNKVKILTSGIFGAKRGLHTDVVCVCDDILSDQENPLNFTQLEKIERFFNAETSNIPNKGCPMIVVGTIQDKSDLLWNLRSNEQYVYRIMPAIDPIPDRKYLWPELFGEEELKRRKKQIKKAFDSEFLLTPVISVDAYFKPEDLEKVTDSNLENYSIYRRYLSSNVTVAGFDIGKRRHPSHLSIFELVNGKLKMVHQSFWDGVDYIEQVNRLKSAIDNFNIDKLYIDNTRGEMDDRDLPRGICELITFTQKNKSMIARSFADRVFENTIELLDDERYLNQILCVSNALDAPETPMGHGDSMWSTGLACYAFQEHFSDKGRVSLELANMQEMYTDKSSDGNLFSAPEKRNRCKFCNSADSVEEISEGKFKCDICLTRWSESIGGEK